MNSGVLRIKLARQMGLGDHGIMRREMTSLVTKRADPNLCGEVDTRKRVENGGARLATERRVRESGDLRVRTDRGDRGGEWNNALAGLDLGARPNIPGHTNSIDSFGICVRHF